MPTGQSSTLGQQASSLTNGLGSHLGQPTYYMPSNLLLSAQHGNQATNANTLATLAANNANQIYDLGQSNPMNMAYNSQMMALAAALNSNRTSPFDSATGLLTTANQLGGAQNNFMQFNANNSVPTAAGASLNMNPNLNLSSILSNQNPGASASYYQHLSANFPAQLPDRL